MIGDELLAGVKRGGGGHVYLPDDAVPTWGECVALIEEQRDRHLRKVRALLERFERELEAVRNDISEAREHPRQTLGVDLIAFGDWRHQHRMSGETTSAAILQQFVLERSAVERYHDMLDEVHSPGFISERE